MKVRDSARGLNPLVGPGSSTLDLSLAKQFHVPFREKDALQFRAEAFNALNHPQFANPDSSLGDG
ncbi:MAG TPA: hypothetical protein VLT57_09860, partial [Bryobacteraceae bacterium]|nr:hypothetical protein [Bryobacteraceae bacterium]